MSKADLHVKLAGGQQVVGGFSIQPYNAGTPVGSTIPDPTKGNYQYFTNSGALTINTPLVDCAIDILITNGSTAGALTFSGYTVGFVGDSFTTTNGHRFIVSIRRINTVSTYTVKALQ